MPASPFLSDSAPVATPAADTAATSLCVERSVAAEPFSNSATPPSPAVADTAAVDQPAPQVAAAGTIYESTLDPATGVDAAAAPDLTDPPDAAAEFFDEPSSNEGRPKSAPALDAPNTHDDAGATNHIGEIFHWVRKLMKDDVGFILDEAAFMADVEEIPLFLRDDDGYLKRQA